LQTSCSARGSVHYVGNTDVGAEDEADEAEDDDGDVFEDHPSQTAVALVPESNDLD